MYVCVRARACDHLQSSLEDRYLPPGSPLFVPLASFLDCGLIITSRSSYLFMNRVRSLHTQVHHYDKAPKMPGNNRNLGGRVMGERRLKPRRVQLALNH